MHLAAKHAGYGMIQLLLARGADPELRDQKGKTAAEVAGEWSLSDPQQLRQLLEAANREPAAVKPEKAD